MLPTTKKPSLASQGRQMANFGPSALSFPAANVMAKMQFIYFPFIWSLLTALPRRSLFFTQSAGGGDGAAARSCNRSSS
jgi:hypothetical protein